MKKNLNLWEENTENHYTKYTCNLGITLNKLQ